jgi:CheY-like chemotaxis protein
MVVLVDDNEDDLFFIERELRKTELPLDLWRFDRPEEAKNFFTALLGSEFTVPKDLVIFCDIKMPRISGFELMAWLKQETRFHGARIYFLSGSNEPGDRDRARALQVAGYCVKFPTAE